MSNRKIKYFQYENQDEAIQSLPQRGVDYSAVNLEDFLDKIFFDSGNYTSAIGLPNGTTAQRPSSPLNGDMRYNSTTLKVEVYENGAWKNFATTSSGLSGLIENEILFGDSTGDATSSPNLTFDGSEFIVQTSSQRRFNITDSAIGLSNTSNEVIFNITDSIITLAAAGLENGIFYTTTGGFNIQADTVNGSAIKLGFNDGDWLTYKPAINITYTTGSNLYANEIELLVADHISFATAGYNGELWIEDDYLGFYTSTAGQIEIGTFGFTLQNFASDPLVVQEGSIFYNTTDKAIKLYNGTAWKEIIDWTSATENLITTGQVLGERFYATGTGIQLESSGVVFWQSAMNILTLDVASVTGINTVTIPDKSGTIALLSDITGGFSVSGTDTNGSIITADGAGGGTRESDLSWASNILKLAGGSSGDATLYISSASTAPNSRFYLKADDGGWVDTKVYVTDASYYTDVIASLDTGSEPMFYYNAKIGSAAVSNRPIATWLNNNSKIAELSAGGQLTLHNYSTGSYPTGTTAKWLTVDAFGNVITEDAPIGFSVSGTDTAGAVITADGAGGGTRKSTLTFSSSVLANISTNGLIRTTNNGNNQLDIGTLASSNSGNSNVATLRSIDNSATGRPALEISGSTSVDSGTDAVIEFIALNGVSSFATRPLFAWYNYTTKVAEVAANGNWDIDGNIRLSETATLDLTSAATSRSITRDASAENVVRGSYGSLSEAALSIYASFTGADVVGTIPVLALGGHANLSPRPSIGFYANNSLTAQLENDGTWDYKSNSLTNIADPTSAQDAATKNYVDTNAGTSGILKKEVTLTVSQLQNLHTTPIDIIDAPGVDKFIHIHTTTCSVNYVSATYNSATLQLKETDASGTVYYSYGNAGLTTANDSHTIGTKPTGLFNNEMNKKIVLSSTADLGLSGDSELKLQIYYTIESI